MSSDFAAKEAEGLGVAKPSPRRAWLVALAIVAMALGCALLLAVPGRTITTKYLNDLLIFLDGGYRILSGQVPSRDFHTPMGPLAYLLPAAGLWLSGSFGGSMPTGIALLTVALAPVLAYVLSVRLRAALAIPLAAFLLLVLVAPVNMGESPTDLSFAMFYNRIGWVALAAVLVMFLDRAETGFRGHFWDSLCAASLVLIMLYTKISYGAVGLAFLVFMLFDRCQRPWAAMALAITVATGLAVEAVFGFLTPYLSDIMQAGEVSGPFWGGIERLAGAFDRNAGEFVLFALLVGFAPVQARSLRDFLFYAGCASAGLLLINQNYQVTGIVTLAAGAAVGAERLSRSSDERARTHAPAWARSGVAALLLAALVLPTIIERGSALGRHVLLASSNQAADLAVPNFGRIGLATVGSPEEYQSAADYVETLEDGARALAELQPKPSHVAVLDFVNPFSASLGLAPPRGDTSWNHATRTFDEEYFLPAEQMFADVRVVMEPKRPVDWGTTESLRKVYGQYLAANFDLVSETQFWRVFRRRDPQASGRASGRG